MKFVVNLRPKIIESYSNINSIPDSWLLSTHRITNQTLQLAQFIRSQGNVLFADNGTKDLIDSVLKEFKPKAKQISREVANLRKKLGNIPRGKKVPVGLRKRASTLASEVVKRCTGISDGINMDKLLEEQLSMNPTHLIAQEDFSIACLIGLDLEREITGWSISRILSRNKKSIELWKEYVSKVNNNNLIVYTVLSGMDYNTAFSVGKYAANEGVEHVALGTAGIMLDVNTVDFLVKNHSSFKIDPPVLRRYIRYSQICMGLSDGYAEMGKYMKSFHALGLGAATLFPVMVGSMDPRTNLTIDSTSPIHDAVRDNIMYDPKRFADRLNVWNIAEEIVKGTDWSFICDFCKDYKNNYGHDVDAATNWWRNQNKREITKGDLKPGTILGNSLPLLQTTSRSPTGPIRIAHNHDIILRYMNQIPNDSTRISWAKESIDKMINYEYIPTRNALICCKEIVFQ